MIVTWLTYGRDRFRRSAISRLALAALALALASGVALPGVASADVGMKIIERCGRGESLAGFTVKQYQRALKEINADTEVLEYSACAEEVQRALDAAASHKGGSSGVGGQGTGTGPGGAGGSGGVAGGSTAAVEPTPAQVRTLEQTRQSGAPPVHFGGHDGTTILPGVVHPDLASATSNLPTPVLVVIALVLAGLLLLAGREIRARLAGPRHS